MHADAQVPVHEDEDENEGENEERGFRERAGAGAGRDATALILAGRLGGALDGREPAPHGPWARVGVAFGRFELAAAGDLAAWANIHDVEATLRIKRSDAFASAAFALVRAPRAQRRLRSTSGWRRSSARR